VEFRRYCPYLSPRGHETLIDLSGNTANSEPYVSKGRTIHQISQQIGWDRRDFSGVDIAMLEVRSCADEIIAPGRGRCHIVIRLRFARLHAR
jgi:hypothetical protein